MVFNDLIQLDGQMVQCYEVCGNKVTPKTAKVRRYGSNTIVLQCRVASGHHIIHIGLLIPEILQNYLTLGLNLQEVSTGREAADDADCADYIIIILFHNLHFSIFNFQSTLELEVNRNTQGERTRTRSLCPVDGRALTSKGDIGVNA